MRVLHLPVNIASQIQIAVKALRDLGVEARGLVRGSHGFQSSDGLEGYYGSHFHRQRYSLPWFWAHMVAIPRVLMAIRWADVVHYHYGGSYALPLELDVTWACALGKPRLINFWGSDIRIAEIEVRDNPYYARRNQAYEYWVSESYGKSHRLQTYYARRGFTCVVGSETMFPHIETSLFPNFHLVRCSIDVMQVQPQYPDPGRRRVVLAHSPSAPLAKGTPAVLSAVDALRNERSLDFILIQNMPRQQALDLVKTADIYLDQFVIGGYGMAAIEAMAMGKAVVCYIAPSLASHYPPDLPIVNANQDNLADVLEELLKDGGLRHELGRRSRAYAEKYHDAHQNAQQLISIYEDLLARRDGKR